MYMKKNVKPRLHQCNADSFIRHLNQYVGQTVTVYTDSGGTAGLGFTGILLAVTPFMISLVTSVAPPPASPFYGYEGYCPPSNEPIQNVGSITDIPIDKITAFVHNAL